MGFTYINAHTHTHYRHSTQYIPYWEANRFSDSHEIPPYFVEPEGSLTHS